MTFYWSNVSLLDGGFGLAGHAKSVKFDAMCDMLDTTPVNTTGWRTFIPGPKSGAMDVELMADHASGGLDATMWSRLGVADVPKSFTFTDDGSVAYLMRGVNLSYTPIEGAVGDLAGAKVSGVSSTGKLIRGKLIHPSSATRTSSGTGTGRQVGAVIAGKSLYAALHVLSVAGTDTPTLTVKVQSDDNSGFTTPTDRITFTGATAIGAQWGSVAGAVTDDYWRVSYTISGTDPAFVFAVTVGIL